MDRDRLQFLLQRHFDQMLSAAERAELERMLLTSPGAREAFWEAARWHALLRQWGEAEWGRLDAEQHDVQPPSHGHPARRLALAALAAGALALGALQLAESRRPAVLAEPPGPPAKGVAVLASAADAVWIDPGDSRQAGQSLPPGWVRLASGAVQLDFARGARVVLEGPAEFELVSEREGQLRTGRLRAQVPEPAKGFTLTAPGLTVVDRGSEVAFKVPATGATEVHVFSGEVDVNLAASGGPRQSLRQNEAVRVERGQAHPIQSAPGKFLSEQELARRAAEQVRVRVAAWRKASGRFSQEQGVLVHLDFEPEGTWQRALENRATNSAARTPASIIGCDWEYGRWPGKLALDFKRPADRLRLPVPGAFESLTLVAWVRVTSLPGQPQALLMSDSFQRGALQWYLTTDGGLGVGVHVAAPDTPGDGWRHGRSAPVIRPEMLGAWVQIATVLDGATGLATHYFNGRPAGASDLGFAGPLRPGTCELGNASTLAGNAPRHFEGRMDEFGLVSAALGPDDLLRLHEDGRPGDSTILPSLGPLMGSRFDGRPPAQP
jgi:hypothetical protein